MSARRNLTGYLAAVGVLFVASPAGAQLFVGSVIGVPNSSGTIRIGFNRIGSDCGNFVGEVYVSAEAWDGASYYRTIPVPVSMSSSAQLNALIASELLSQGWSLLLTPDGITVLGHGGLGVKLLGVGHGAGDFGCIHTSLSNVRVLRTATTAGNRDIRISWFDGLITDPMNYSLGISLGAGVSGSSQPADLFVIRDDLEADGVNIEVEFGVPNALWFDWDDPVNAARILNGQLSIGIGFSKWQSRWSPPNYIQVELPPN
ncbi:MAG: hypothetical protein CHACPFDD_03859 [Phycisphaerae bacterium]|nr:hypothetical protein [Phycisphaerae bacterium]